MRPRGALYEATKRAGGGQRQRWEEGGRGGGGKDRGMRDAVCSERGLNTRGWLGKTRQVFSAIFLLWRPSPSTGTVKKRFRMKSRSPGVDPDFWRPRTEKIKTSDLCGGRWRAHGAR
eukprot:9475504-Pyramimonas_sp.AAC.1